jgi:hypothetical protein
MCSKQKSEKKSENILADLDQISKIKVEIKHQDQDQDQDQELI